MGFRLTTKRKLVLEKIESSDLPLHAGVIHKTLKNRVNLATIYRTLQYLEHHGLVDAFTIPCSQEGTIRFYHKKTKNHVHFFHCESCHTFISLPVCTLDKVLSKSKELRGGKMNSHVLYCMGICPKCNRRNKKEYSA